MLLEARAVGRLLQITFQRGAVHVAQIVYVLQIKAGDQAVRPEQRRLHHQIGGAGVAEIGAEQLALDARQVLRAVFR
ncbi:hypothetical protein ACPRNU_11460 [Chromobacterium vaccinii]|uniref:hypothetical protein n=1 Tax=Chromobacterium vaccinii TaxID=1108595 RepID=UPI003C774E4A